MRIYKTSIVDWWTDIRARYKIPLRVTETLNGVSCIATAGRRILFIGRFDAILGEGYICDNRKEAR